MIEEPADPADMNNTLLSPLANPSAASVNADRFQNGDGFQKDSEQKNDALQIYGYSYSLMANYAKQYALNYNSVYRSFSSDCTNLISQAMSAGGWARVSGYYTSNNAWWYNWFNQSYT